jgi:type I restriction enzyme S subunit
VIVDWPEVTLGDICSFQNGGTPSRDVPKYFDGGIPWLTGADITGPVAGECRTFISSAGVGASAACVVPKGTVLLVTVRVNLFETLSSSIH